MITSLQNARVKQAIKLRESGQRRKQMRILIDGAREIQRAILAGIELTEVFFCEELCRSEAATEVLSRLHDPGQTPGTPELLPVTPAVFEKMAFGDRAEGILAVAVTPQRSLENLKLPENPLIAILEGVEKPGNVGAVLRSADGAGVAALIVADGGTDLFNPNTIRASLGTIFTVPVCAASTAETLQWLAKRGIPTVATWVDAARSYTAADYRGPVAIVLGSEADGLSAAWQEATTAPVTRSLSTTDWSAAGNSGKPKITAVHLPMLGIADSLNVSTAAAVMFYEAVRQRGANAK
ncbi:MAG: RNA methyltransferase [Planctomycetota bacterium]|nr:RNA methyltransferase [Planctomycetota bacterium]